MTRRRYAAVPLEAHADACASLERDLIEAFGREAPVRPLIEAAVAAYRRQLQAHDEIEAHGMFIEGPRGLSAHPAVMLEDRARRSVAHFISCARLASGRTRIGGPTRTEQLPRKPTSTPRGTRYFATG
jgi:hypothetical protein